MTSNKRWHRLKQKLRKRQTSDLIIILSTKCTFPIPFQCSEMSDLFLNLHPNDLILSCQSNTWLFVSFAWERAGPPAPSTSELKPHVTDHNLSETTGNMKLHHVLFAFCAVTTLNVALAISYANCGPSFPILSQDPVRTRHWTAFSPVTNEYLVVYSQNITLFAQRLNSLGHSAGPVIVVQENPYFVDWPSVVWGQNSYLIAWEMQISEESSTAYVRGMYPNGTFVDVDKEIVPFRGAQVWQPVVEYREATGEFYVAFSVEAPQNQTLGADVMIVTVSAAGDVSNSVQMSLLGDQMGPRMAYNGNSDQIAVVFETTRYGEYDVFGATFTGDLANQTTWTDSYSDSPSQGSPIPVGYFQSGINDHSPSISYSPRYDLYMITWQTDYLDNNNNQEEIVSIAMYYDDLGYASDVASWGGVGYFVREPSIYWSNTYLDDWVVSFQATNTNSSYGQLYAWEVLPLVNRAGQVYFNVTIMDIDTYAVYPHRPHLAENTVNGSTYGTWLVVYDDAKSVSWDNKKRNFAEISSQESQEYFSNSEMPIRSKLSEDENQVGEFSVPTFNLNKLSKLKKELLPKKRMDVPFDYATGILEAVLICANGLVFTTLTTASSAIQGTTSPGNFVINSNSQISKSGIIAAAVIIPIAVVAFLIVIVVFLVMRRRRQQNTQAKVASADAELQEAERARSAQGEAQ
eukprot:TRINITY_DN6199_c0_g2_i1.p1 TRINITY_DN6199_c0_g2~~TRINITY_DN6199_c0_g2_i1.p1  ORF type:complete len:688 (-),score=161.41 TRINITY_DN6199_c0_g2_i1:158-2221(-)